MATAERQHVTAVEHRPTSRPDVWITRGVCSCGWEGEFRRDELSAADDTAAHLLEVQS
jgi:hypothetical protein